jgi:uncharacterized membrane protein
MERQEKFLRSAFLAGAITDGLVVLPMLSPTLASILWDFADMSGSYRFAMGYGASLMFGWTVLLLRAYQKPQDRKFVTALTVLVISGLAFTEMAAVLTGRKYGEDSAVT